MTEESPPPFPSFGEAFRFWWKLGWISFGGPAGQIAIMHKELVESRRWISESHFLHAVNFCMLLPGPEAQQLVTYLGWRLHGWRGGVVAGVLFVVPSIFILLGLFLHISIIDFNSICLSLVSFVSVSGVSISFSLLYLSFLSFSFFFRHLSSFFLFLFIYFSFHVEFSFELRSDASFV